MLMCETLACLGLLEMLFHVFDDNVMFGVWHDHENPNLLGLK